MQLALAFSCSETSDSDELAILKPLPVLKGLNYSAVLEAEAEHWEPDTRLPKRDQDRIQYSRPAVWSMQHSLAHSVVETAQHSRLGSTATRGSLANWEVFFITFFFQPTIHISLREIFYTSNTKQGFLVALNNTSVKF